MTDDPLLAEVLDAIPGSLRGVSGDALYSGREAWTNPSPIYLMGINPGGDPADLSTTVATQAAAALRPDSFSAYRDLAWTTPRGNLYEPGKHPMQRSVLHLLDRLGLDPAKVPTSNMVYARSRQAHHIAADDMRAWAEECWPFHLRMIERLGCRVVVAWEG